MISDKLAVITLFVTAFVGLIFIFVKTKNFWK